MAITNAERNEIIALFVGVFNAAPGADNLDILVPLYEGGASMQDLANAMAGTAQFKSLYPNHLTGEEFIDRLADNLLGDEVSPAKREEASEIALSMLNGGMTRAEVMLEAVQMLSDVTAAQPAFVDARDALVNKVEVAKYYSVDLEQSNESILELQQVLNGVTSDPETVETAKAAIDSSANLNPGQTYDLTIGEDNIVGTSGNDTFNARIVQDNNGNPQETLEDIDGIDGGAGTDTLNATLQGGTVAASISNVEIINVRAVGAGTSTFDMSNVAGAEQVWSSNSTQQLDILAAASAATYGLRSTGADLDITYASGTTLNLALENADGSSVTTGAAMTKVNITAAGENDVDLTNIGAATTKLTIDGSGELEIQGFDATALATLAAGGFEGDLTLDISAASSTDLSVTTGAGDDVVTIDGTLLVAANKNVSIDLGEGSNGLALANIIVTADVAALDFTVASISGVHALGFADAVTFGADALDLEGLSDLEELVIVDTGGASGTMTLENAPETLTFEVHAAVTADLDFGEVETLTINAEANITSALDGSSGDLETLDVNIEDDAVSVAVAVALDIVGDATNGSISSLTLSDNSDDEDGSFAITLEDTVDLATINISGGESTAVQIDAASAGTDGADFGGTVTINIGTIGIDEDGALVGVGDGSDAAGADGTVFYTTDDGNAVREIFKFVGDDIGVVVVDGFHAGVLGSNDRLDFSAFDGVNELDDLNVAELAAGDYLITSDGFTGSIFLTGTIGDPTDDVANFIF